MTTPEVAEIIIRLPLQPTSADLLLAFSQVEEAGYRRALSQARSAIQQLPGLLRRQAQ